MESSRCGRASGPSFAARSDGHLVTATVLRAVPAVAVPRCCGGASECRDATRPRPCCGAVGAESVARSRGGGGRPLRLAPGSCASTTRRCRRAAFGRELGHLPRRASGPRLGSVLNTAPSERPLHPDLAAAGRPLPIPGSRCLALAVRSAPARPPFRGRRCRLPLPTNRNCAVGRRDGFSVGRGRPSCWRCARRPAGAARELLPRWRTAAAGTAAAAPPTPGRGRCGFR